MQASHSIQHLHHPHPIMSSTTASPASLHYPSSVHQTPIIGGVQLSQHLSQATAAAAAAAAAASSISAATSSSSSTPSSISSTTSTNSNPLTGSNNLS